MDKIITPQEKLKYARMIEHSHNLLGLVNRCGGQQEICEYASVLDFMRDLVRRFYFRKSNECCSLFLEEETCLDKESVYAFMIFWAAKECEDSDSFPKSDILRQMLFLLRLIKSFCRFFADQEIIPGDLYDELDMAFYEVWRKVEGDYHYYMSINN